MSISTSELRDNLGKYLQLAEKEDIFITKNGKVIAKLTNPHRSRIDEARSLFGILPRDTDLDDVKLERLMQD